MSHSSEAALSAYMIEGIMALEAAGQSIVDQCKDLRQRNERVQPQQFDELMFSAISAIQRVRNTTCPINRLPTEVLVLVFSLVPERYPVSEDIVERNYWPFTLPAVKIHRQLAVVCKHWRNVILDTPALWSSISESEVLDRRLPNMWYLARCPCGPLLVHISGRVSPRMWSLLRSEGHRIQQLHLTRIAPSEGESMVVLLQTLPADQLEHCKIHFAMPDNDRTPLLSLFSGGGRTLRSLYLCMVLFLPSNTFPRLTNLIIDLSYSHRDPLWNLGDLQNFLAGSPDLEHLHLSQVWCRTGPHPPNVLADTPRVLLPRLRNFTLDVHSRFIRAAAQMILSILELPHSCQIQLQQVPLNALQALSPSLLSLERPLTRMRLALGAAFYHSNGSPRWDWSLVLASHQPECAPIRLVLEPAHTAQVPSLVGPGAAFSKLPLFADVEELWYSSNRFDKAVLSPVLLPPKVRGLALNIQSWAPSHAAGYLAQVARVCAQLDTLCICVPNMEHLRDVREALSVTSPGPSGRPRCRAIRRVAVGYDRASTRLSRGAISLRDCGAGTEASWTGHIARQSGDEMGTGAEMERLLSVAPQVLEEPASIRASWPTWPDFLSH